MPSAAGRGTEQRAADDDGDVALAAQVLERLDQRFGFDDAGVGRPERRVRALHVRLLLS